MRLVAKVVGFAFGAWFFCALKEWDVVYYPGWKLTYYGRLPLVEFCIIGVAILVAVIWRSRRRLSSSLKSHFHALTDPVDPDERSVRRRPSHWPPV